MKKYIVLSVNDNPEYLFYLPLTVWAWRKFGWEPIIFHARTGIDRAFDNSIWKFVTGSIFDTKKSIPFIYYIYQLSGYPSEMIAQISRLYASCELTELSFIMTGDIDMIPLSDYWSFNENEITVWGRDLTDYHYPICYIGMNTSKWIDVMNLKDGIGKPYQTGFFIKRDLDSMPNAKSEDLIKRWVVDQDLITDRLNNCGLPITKIDRGIYPNGYPVGRVDRSAWTLEHEQLIDCHMLRSIWKNEEYKRMTMQLLHKVWPEEDFTWFEKYIEEFKKLVNG